jgi:hypothetical protein
MILATILLILCSVSPLWATALDDAATTATAGQFVQLQSPQVTGLTTTLTQATHPAGTPTGCAEAASAHNILEFQDKGTWDRKNKKAYIYGGGHNSGHKLISYTDSTSTWAEHGNASFAPDCHYAHLYGKQTFNPHLGYFYLRGNGLSQIVYRYDPAAQTYSPLPTLPTSMGAIAGLEYFPDIGKLVLYGRLGLSGGTSSILTYQEGDAAWTVVANNIQTSCGDGDRALYNPRWRVMMFFPCTTQSGLLTWYTWNASQGTGAADLVSMPAGPAPWGYQGTGQIVTVDPVSGDVLVFNDGKQFWKFDFTTNAWTRLTGLEASVPFWGAHSVGNPSGGNADDAWSVVAVPDPSHGGVIFLTCGGSTSCSSLPRMYFYKHATPNNFQAKCMGFGVVTCIDFDREAHFLFYNWSTGVAACNTAFAGKSNYSGSSLSPRTWPTNIFAKDGQSGRCDYPKIDTAIKANGLGSLRFDILSQSTFNSAAVFDSYFARRGNGTFVCFSNHASCQGNTYYLQFKIRFDTVHGDQDYECTSSAGGSITSCGGHKNIIVYASPAADSTACCTSQIYLVNGNETDVPYLASVQGTQSADYQNATTPTACTEKQARSTGASSATVNNYSGRSFWLAPINPDCVHYGRNIFKEYTFRVTIGTSGGFDSRVELWIDGAKTTDYQNVRLFFGGSDGEGHGQFELLSQLTNKSNTQIHAEGKIWYDDFIVSSQPIAMGGVDDPGPPPPTPTPGAPFSFKVSAENALKLNSNIKIQGAQ